MFLSRLTFNQAEPVVLRALGDLHAMHRLLLQAFPDAQNGGPHSSEQAAGRVLYRVERPARPRDYPQVLVQSAVAPDFETARPGYTPLARLACIDGPKEWNLTLTTGQLLRFRLRASPTVTKQFGPEATKPGHRRVGLHKEEEQHAWFQRKAGASGFAVVELRVTPLGKLGGRSPSGDTLTHTGADFDGLLRVTDPDLLLGALHSGIGAGKAWGFGLLSLARA